MPKTVILGYYGFSNTGDEALLEAISGSLRHRCPGLDIAVLTGGANAAAGAAGVTAVNRWDPGRILRTLREADLLIAGGGTLLQDGTSLRSLAYYVAVILAAARLTGTKVMIYANGLGPLRTRTGRFLAGQALQAADIVTLRDSKSLRDLERWFPALAGKAVLTADPALLLQPDAPEKAQELLAAAGLPENRPFIAACVRAWEGVAYEAPLAAALDAVARRRRLATVFLPMQMPRDAEASRRVMAQMRTPAFIVDRAVPPRLFMALLGQAGVVAAMRLHAAILAAAQHVPALGLAYDPKVEGVLADLDLPVVGRPGELTARRLAGVLEDLLDRRGQIAAHLRERVAALRELAEHDAELAVSLLKTESGPGR